MIELQPGRREYEDIRARIRCGTCGKVFTVGQKEQLFKCPGCGKAPTEGAQRDMRESLGAFGDAEYRMEYDRRQGRPGFALVDMKIIRTEE